MCAVSLRYIREHPELLERLRANTVYMKSGLRKLGLEVGDSIVPVATFVIGTDQTMQALQQRLMDEGIHVFYSTYIGAGVAGVIRCGIFADPQNEMEARFSLTYCTVRVLQTGRLTLNDMTLEKVREASIRPWLRRIVIHTKPGSVSEELGEKATPAITRVVLKTGQVHEVGILAPKGSKQVPLSEEEKRDKFHDCCRWAGKEECANRLFEAALSIRELPRLTEFSRALAQCCSSLTCRCASLFRPN